MAQFKRGHVMPPASRSAPRGPGGTVETSVRGSGAYARRSAMSVATAFIAASLPLPATALAPAPKPAARRPAGSAPAPPPATASPDAIGKVIGNDDAEAKARDDAEPQED